MSDTQSANKQNQQQSVANTVTDIAATCPVVRAFPFERKTRKRFTREEIKAHILGRMLLDPQPSGKPLSKREKAENAMHEYIATYFDEPQYSDEF